MGPSLAFVVVGLSAAFQHPQLRAVRRVGVATAASEGGYTLVGADGKEVSLTVQEKERIFVDAMQSYYYSGRQLLSDVEFDQLKEELMWEGSEYAMLSRNETMFLSAVGAYSRGEPAMSDAEFDELKASLKAQGSIVATSKEPRCFLDTGVCSVTFVEDKFRKLVLYVPALLLSVAAWTGGTYELVPASRGLNPLISLLVGFPIISVLTSFVTEQLIFVEPLIATGPCPECGYKNRIFFGDILGVQGPTDFAEVDCPNCKTKLTIQRDTLRVSTPPKK
ncbi:hypothetical protein CTAYLR_002513 [Chrysophaeum taylorii]|uniref:Uncharacterized protein n=1 Tax=Chrysophaeum taylorii TaxID=2483200 RepID=A0AAD7UFL3_9STRA|nr:hypothetical protein CTAYLR_002513 [Chrysophaeum taylorii]